MLIWYVRSTSDKDFRKTVRELLSTFVVRQELESKDAAKLFNLDLVDVFGGVSRFIEHVIRSRIDSAKKKSQQQEIIDLYDKVFSGNDRKSCRMRVILLRILTSKFDQLIPEKFSERFDTQTLEIKKRNIPSILMSLLYPVKIENSMSKLTS